MWCSVMPCDWTDQQGQRTDTEESAGTESWGIHSMDNKIVVITESKTEITSNGNSQEATVRTGHGTTDWFQIGTGVQKGCILSPCLFNFCAENSMRNVGLDEAQAGIKIARRNINHLRYAGDTTLMAESKEELKSLLMKMKKESEKAGLKLNIQKTFKKQRSWHLVPSLHGK